MLCNVLFLLGIQFDMLLFDQYTWCQSDFMAFVVMARIQMNVSEKKNTRKNIYIYCGDCYVSYIILVMSYKWLLGGFSFLFSIKWGFFLVSLSLFTDGNFNQFVTQEKCAILIHPHVELRLNAVFRM